MIPREKKLLSDEELEQDRKNNDYKRDEELRNTAHRVILFVIYLLVLCIALGVVAYIWYNMYSGNYAELANTGKVLVGAGFGYLLAYLRYKNIMPKE